MKKASKESESSLMRYAIYFLLVVLLIPVLRTHAQEAMPEATPEAVVDVPLPAPQTIEIDAADGLALTGDFYLVAPDRPTLVLLHQLYDTRHDWESLRLPLLTAGYNLLIVDLRGFGDTGGDIHWRKAADDIGIWLTWLRAEAAVQPDAISVMGSSIGSSLAVVGCARDAACRTAIAVSPGWNYYGLSLEDSIAAKPVLVIYAENDRWPALGVPRMVEAASAQVETATYPGNAHGMSLLTAESETVLPRILDWLTAH